MAHLKKGDKRSKAKQQKDALAAFEDLANISLACKKANVSRRSFYNWMNEANFKAKFDSAVKIATGVLEDEAVRRATQGVVEPVFYQGIKVGGIKRYSDTLLIVLLKAHAPEKYKERFSGEIAGIGGGPIKTQHIPLSDEEIKKFSQVLEDQL